MSDMFSAGKRSEIMARVRSRDNKATEIAMLRLFRRHCITGWRRHARVFGNPDFVFPKHRVAVFVDGCFWHCCPRHAAQPVSNAAFWKAKLARNKSRDRVVTRTLKQRGWFVLRVWQHELPASNETRLVRRIERALGLG